MGNRLDRLIGCGKKECIGRIYLDGRMQQKAIWMQNESESSASSSPGKYKKDYSKHHQAAAVHHKQNPGGARRKFFFFVVLFLLSPPLLGVSSDAERTKIRPQTPSQHSTKLATELLWPSSNVLE